VTRTEARKNIRLGILMFVTALIMLAVAAAWAFIYNAFV